MADAIRLQGVRKTFGQKVAVRSMDLAIPEGSLYGFLGPNGAGKSTTIRMIMSILFPDEGRIEVLGRKSAVESKDRIGYLPEERGVYRKMKVGAFLEYMARLKGVSGSGLRPRIGEWLERVELPDVQRRRCEELSKGMQQKVQFLAAIIHEPDLLILDEPFSGLDPINMRLMRNMIQEQQQRQGVTVIFSTHVMSQAEAICDHVVMINKGEKVLDDPIDALRARYDASAIVFEPLAPGADLAPLEAVAGVAGVARDGAQAEVTLAPGADTGAVMRGLAAAVAPARLELRRPTLEDIFVEKVTEGARVTAAQVRDALHEPTAAEVAR
ncbi:MAG: ABC transporter ATP-binding protein [Phycisphaerales bacterium JB039]